MASNEKANLDVVREAEAEKHPQIESGDMRFYQNRILTSEMLGKHTPQDWQVIEGEVLANHGYVFGGPGGDQYSKLTLQMYFDGRYWYQRQPDFRANQLSDIEQQNLDTIAVAMMRQNGRQLSVGMMRLFQATPIPDSMLRNVPIADLRLLRNEVYARHGRIFKTPWLAGRFKQYAWYKPRTAYSDSELTTADRANIALIAAREQQLHDELSTRLLSRREVDGLMNDDARLLRNEIYARHGRRFQDPKLRAYFSSFSWYKPNDSFSEDQLNDFEKKNAILIRRYEEGAFSEG